MKDEYDEKKLIKSLKDENNKLRIQNLDLKNKLKHIADVLTTK